MAPAADQYRVKAPEFTSLAGGESNSNLQLAYAAMAQAYFRLAVLADQNAKTNLVYETPAIRSLESP